MGNKLIFEKPAMDDLCSNIILLKGDGQVSQIEPKLKEDLRSLRSTVKDLKKKEKLISEIKDDMKSIPSLIFCLIGKTPSGNFMKDVQLEALKTLSKFIKADEYFVNAIFEKELVHLINGVALSHENLAKHVAVKILSYLTRFKERFESLDLYNPLYTFNSMLASIKGDITMKTRLAALNGIIRLSVKYKNKFVSNGIIGTLLTILNESTNTSEISLAMKCLSESADDFDVSKNLMDEHFALIVDNFLDHNDIKVRTASASTIQAICKLDEGRNSINLPTLKFLHNLSISTNTEAALSAKSALLSLCLNEVKYEYLKKKKGWIEEMIRAFYELGTLSNRKRIAGIIYQLSCECLKYTLYELYKAMQDPIMILLVDKDEEVSSQALKSLLNLSFRLDLQSGYVSIKAPTVLIEIFEKTENIEKKQECISVLAMLSITSLQLLNSTEYSSFFLASIDRNEYQISKDTVEEVEKIIKIAKVTCIAFSGEEVQTRMRDKIRFVYSQCRSPEVKIRCRAVGTLGTLALRQPLRELLQETNFFSEIMQLLRDSEIEVKSIACYAITNILSSPDNLEIWFKFDSGYVIDASNNYILSGAMQNTYLKNKKGLYANWGKEFKKNEVVKIQNMMHMDEWTLSVWFLTPLPKGLKILIQGASGTGAIIGANNEYFFIIDQKSGAEIILCSGIDKLIDKRWHHFAVSMGQDGEVSGYLDKQKSQNKTAYISEGFKYFANSKKGKNPFGTICDLRIYSKCLSVTEIENLSYKNENILDGLPDKYCEYANITDITTFLIEIIRKEGDIIKIVALQALSSLATKSSCRSSMLRNAVIAVLVDSIRSFNQQIQRYAAKCLVNLG